VSVAALKDAAAFADLGEGARLAIIDLRLPGALEILAAIKGHATHSGVRTIGFIDHERTDVMDEARALGCDEVMSKGQFSNSLPRLLDFSA
jgi:DNA-binding NarL/FixJ family response regulator